jgi:hypothetical protein
VPDLPALPPIASQPLSIILLAHNASAHVEAVLRAWLAHLERDGRDYEVLLVDDGSADDTADRATKLAESHSKVRVARREVPQGEGAALRTALPLARHPLLFYTLCQPAYQPRYLPRLFEVIDQVHVVSGYRAGRPVPQPWRAVGWLWRLFCRVVFSHAPAPLPGWLGWKGQAGQLLIRLLFGVRNGDPLCPYRLLRREVFRRIPLQSDGPFAHVEIVAKSNFLGHVHGEDVPLDDRRQPLVPGPRPRGEVRRMFAEGNRVFQHPDFGPAVLPDDSAAEPPAPLPEGGKEGVTGPGSDAPS